MKVSRNVKWTAICIGSGVIWVLLLNLLFPGDGHRLTRTFFNLTGGFAIGIVCGIKSK